MKLSETITISDYWTDEEREFDIASREALALDKALASFSNLLQNAWVDARVDNRAVVDAWSSLGGRSASLSGVLKRLFFTTSRLNISLHVGYVASGDNPADAPSRRLSFLGSKLHPDFWSVVQSECGIRRKVRQRSSISVTHNIGVQRHKVTRVTTRATKLAFDHTPEIEVKFAIEKRQPSGWSICWIVTRRYVAYVK